MLLATSQLRSSYSWKPRVRAACNSLRQTGNCVFPTLQWAVVRVPVGDRLFCSPNSTISQVMLSIGVESMTLRTSLQIYARRECVENCDVWEEKVIFWQFGIGYQKSTKTALWSLAYGSHRTALWRAQYSHSNAIIRFNKQQDDRICIMLKKTACSKGCSRAKETDPHICK